MRQITAFLISVILFIVSLQRRNAGQNLEGQNYSFGDGYQLWLCEQPSVVLLWFGI